MYHWLRRTLDAVDHHARQQRQLASEVHEDLREDRDDEHQHRDEHERCEREDHRRVDHRALDAALDLRLLLDLFGDPVEDVVEHARGLARLHHRDVELVEHLRVTRHRLREEKPSLDVGAELGDDLGQVDVVGLLLEDHQGRDDVEACLDHRRELAREDLHRARLDLLERRAQPVLAARGQLAERVRQQAADAQLLARRLEVGGVDLADGLETVDADCAVGESGHYEPPHAVVVMSCAHCENVVLAGP